MMKFISSQNKFQARTEQDFSADFDFNPKGQQGQGLQGHIGTLFQDQGQLGHGQGQYHVPGFTAVPFDYSNANIKLRNPGRNKHEIQTVFPPGVNPADYPNLKPGAKVYLNREGKVRVRGDRGGSKGRGRKRPGLGSKGNLNLPGSKPRKNPGPQPPNIAGPSGSNATPVGQPGGQGHSIFTSTTHKRFGGAGRGGGRGRGGRGGGAVGFKSHKQQVKDDNAEYSEWLANKSWLHQAIP